MCQLLRNISTVFITQNESKRICCIASIERNVKRRLGPVL
jgi:hypothetical protein